MVVQGFLDVPHRACQLFEVPLARALPDGIDAVDGHLDRVHRIHVLQALIEGFQLRFRLSDVGRCELALLGEVVVHIRGRRVKNRALGEQLVHHGLQRLVIGDQVLQLVVQLLAGLLDLGSRLDLPKADAAHAGRGLLQHLHIVGCGPLVVLGRQGGLVGLALLVRLSLNQGYLLGLGLALRIPSEHMPPQRQDAELVSFRTPGIRESGWK